MTDLKSRINKLESMILTDYGFKAYHAITPEETTDDVLFTLET